MEKYKITRRSRSEATYTKKHPNGDPFKFNPPGNIAEAKLLGLGLGLYWGEGNKLNKTSIRLGNTDPQLIKVFIKFITHIFGVRKQDLRFGLQIFTDINPEQALYYWINELGVKQEQFCKPTITVSGSIGTYRHKSKFGVVTVNYHNKKLRDLLVSMLPNFSRIG